MVEATNEQAVESTRIQSSGESPDESVDKATGEPVDETSRIQSAGQTPDES